MTTNETKLDADGNQRLKIVIAGDGSTGKTVLLCAYNGGEIPNGYIPTVLDVFTAKIDIKGKETSIEIMDTAGQEDLNQIRTMAYPGSHCVIMCYDVVNPTSLKNVINFWNPEIRDVIPEVPIILCGNKLDLKEGSSTYITEEQAEEETRSIKNIKFHLQCSAHDVIDKTGRNTDSVEKVFQNAILAALYFRNHPPRTGTNCPYFYTLL